MKTKITFVKAEPKDVVESSMTGYLTASYPQLIEVLGEPNDCTKEDEWASVDGKVRVEWAFKSTNKRKPSVVTIYDYKENRPIDEVNQWHVGLKGDPYQAGFFFKERLMNPEALEIRKKYR